MSPTHVLCPLDGTDASARAIPSAIDAARVLDVDLHLFCAVEDAHEIAVRTERLDALGAAAGVPASTRTEVVVAPHAPEAIVERAGTDALVVMATSTQPLIHHGYLGSATEHVARALHRPVLTVGPRIATSLGGVERVVVPCDGSALSERAVDYGAEWARVLGIDLWIVTVLPIDETPVAAVESNYVEQLARRVDGLSAQWEVLHGNDPARALADWAANDLIVLTSHGRSGLSRLTVGSVAVGTARWASGPVLIDVPSAAESEATDADVLHASG